MTGLIMLVLSYSLCFFSAFPPGPPGVPDNNNLAPDIRGRGVHDQAGEGGFYFGCSQIMLNP